MYGRIVKFGIRASLLGVLLVVLLVVPMGCTEEDGGETKSDENVQSGDEQDISQCLDWLQSAQDAPEPPEFFADMRDNIVEQGAGVFPLGENLYYIVRFPENWGKQENRRLIFTLHGSGMHAEQVFSLWLGDTGWCSYALVALQYYDPSIADEEEAHCNATEIYAYMQTIFGEIEKHCPTDDTLYFFHGLSRGSWLTLPLADLDMAGHQYFSSFIADSGAPIDREFALTSLAEAHYWLYCSEQDMVSGDKNKCDEMENMVAMIEDYQGVVDKFYQDPLGGHGMFQNSVTAVEKLIHYIETF